MPDATPDNRSIQSQSLRSSEIHTQVLSSINPSLPGNLEQPTRYKFEQVMHCMLACPLYASF